LTDEINQPALRLIEDLASLQPIKTWSLLVTIFGDMSRVSNRKISGTFLKAMLEPVGVRPEAVRVALHRLRKDGWIVTERDGRETSYGLSASALEETQSAYHDVYRSEIKFPDGWVMMVFPPNNTRPHVGLNVAKQCWLVPAEKSGQLKGALASQLEPSDIPQWINDALVAPETLAIAEKLILLIREIAKRADQIQSAHITIIRFLVLHHWRRMALREETWFHIWANQSGLLATCHKEVMAALDALTCETEAA